MRRQRVISLRMRHTDHEAKRDNSLSAFVLLAMAECRYACSVLSGTRVAVLFIQWHFGWAAFSCLFTTLQFWPITVISPLACSFWLWLPMPSCVCAQQIITIKILCGWLDGTESPTKDFLAPLRRRKEAIGTRLHHKKHNFQIKSTLSHCGQVQQQNLLAFEEIRKYTKNNSNASL